MSEIDAIRHGHKNTDPDAHGTGVEALLDEQRIPEIVAYARKFAENHPKVDEVEIEPSAALRNRQTGEIIYSTLLDIPGWKDRVRPMKVVQLVGSCASDPENPEGHAVNLTALATSKMMQTALKEQLGIASENIPLQKWLSVGIHSLHSRNPLDPGIDIANIALGLGTYIDSKLDSLASSPKEMAVIPISHTGDLEPWLYFTIAMEEGKTLQDLEDPNLLLHYFGETGGALEPLTGYNIKLLANQNLILTHFSGNPYLRPQVPVRVFIHRDTIRRQTELFQQLNSQARRDEVLKQKLALR